MEKSILLLKKDNKKYFLENIKEMQKYYSFNFDFLKILSLKLMKKSKFSLLFKLCLGKWKKTINNYDMVILFDDEYDIEISRYIRRKNKKIKIILWYWNPVSSYVNGAHETDCVDEIWTYNKFDAEKYNFKYNTQFYIKENLENKKMKYDIVFCGKNKGREDNILNVQKEIEKENLICYFKIVNSKKDYISYKDYLDLILSSKCILDYNNEEIAPLTLRPLEALFYNKKLVTNNKDIKNYDFYNSNNIFILGEDKLENLKDFLDREYVEIDKEIIENYSYNKWIQRFKK